MDQRTHTGWLEPLTALAREAGLETLKYFHPSGVPVDHKADGSPVTEADRAAEAVIEAGLARLAPHIPMVGEEANSAGRIPDIRGGPFWLVDPLDGTKDFVRGVGEYTVNIALIEGGVPTLGVIYAPVDDIAYRGLVGGVASKITPDRAVQPISVRSIPTAGLTIVTSRSHRDPTAFNKRLNGVTVSETRPVGSSLKLCLLAEGAADLYPRHGPTMEWDIAAGHAIVVAAGGHLTQLDGEPFTYGKPGFENPNFVAWGAGSHPPGFYADPK